MTRPICYFPGGNVVSEDSPCDPSALYGSTDICLSNNLCYVANINALHRGSCTDKTWQSTACAKNCRNTLGYDDVKECPDDRFSFYCGIDATVCKDGNSSFPLQIGLYADYRNIATVTVSPSTAATITVSVTGGSTMVPTNTTTCPSSSTPLVSVGAGIGVPLGLGLVCALACLFRMRKRQRGPQQVFDTNDSRDQGPGIAMHQGRVRAGG